MLEGLSKPGAVSLKSADPKDKKYMFVKLEDDEARSTFYEIRDDNNYLRAAHLLLCLRQGLRDVFSSALNEAVMINSKTPVETKTGQLRMRPLKPEPHGPASKVSFVWERNVETKASMEVSVDLCHALKLDVLAHQNVLQSFQQPKFAKYLKTVLLMPHTRNFFKMSITESELVVTKSLSQHHKKCYMLLKRLVNGEPQPPERLANCVMKHFQGEQTIFHSYVLKTKIWVHQQNCNEQDDIYGCVNGVLDQLKHEDVTSEHPFTRIPIKDLRVYVDSFDNSEKVSISRVNTLSKELQKINTTPKEKYDFENFCRVIRNNKCPVKCFLKAIDSLLLICCFTTLAINLVLAWTYYTDDRDKKIYMVLGSALYLCAMMYVVFLPGFFRYLRDQRFNKARLDIFMIFCYGIGVLSFILGLLLLILATQQLAIFYVGVFINILILLFWLFFCAVLRT